MPPATLNSALLFPAATEAAVTRDQSRPPSAPGAAAPRVPGAAATGPAPIERQEGGAASRQRGETQAQQQRWKLEALPALWHGSISCPPPQQAPGFRDTPANRNRSAEGSEVLLFWKKDHRPPRCSRFVLFLQGPGAHS